MRVLQVTTHDMLAYAKNVTCLKRFSRYGHYAGEVEDVIVGRLAVVSQITVPKLLERLVVV